MRKNKISYRFISIITFSIILFSLLAASTVMAETGFLKIIKSWDRDESLAPEMVIVDVFNAANNEVVDIIYLREEGDWESTLLDLSVGNYYVKERPVSGYNTTYPAGNNIEITALNNEDNPAELIIENKYNPPINKFLLSIYNVSVKDGIYQVTATILADQGGGFEETFYFNNEKSEVGSIDSETVKLEDKGDWVRIVFSVPVDLIDLDRIHYVGYPQNVWKAIGEPREFIPISVEKSTDLHFGSFTAEAGTITVEPAGGLAIGGGYSGYHDGNQQAAAVEVNWLPNAQYSVSFSNQITISHDQNNMTVRDFTTADNNIGTLDGFGSDIFNIGATLDVTEGLDPGLYTGQFFVTVSFQ